ncbi:MAG: sigma-54 dependent transcriptional regulator [Candidatus Korobacteraceae bacterium]
MKFVAANALAVAEEIPPDPIIFGCTPEMAAIRESIQKIADTNIPVVIEGESGTGKEIICKYIHQRSVWADGPFVKVSCPAIPNTLIESELFGYEKGAFTGAFDTKPGRIEAAHCGTLFLDEISELDFSLQSKLLQLLQDGQFNRIGSSTEKKADVRVVCATNRQLQHEVAGARFRQDLYYRISGLVLRLLPLRERVADIAQLAEYLILLHSAKYKRSVPMLSASMLLLMKTHSWPGNIRELENLMKRYVVLGTEEVIAKELNGRTKTNIDFEVSPESSIALSQVTREAVKDLESRLIMSTLQANQWNRKRAARALHISYRSLLYKLKKVGIDRRHDFKPQ